MVNYMNSHVFREYDIRGIVEDDFSNEFVENLGKAYGTFLIENNHKKASVSGDIRESTIALKKSFICGLRNVGLDVYDLGILPTPVNYFSLFNTDIVNSVQITGSHNPPEFNGFKISYNKKPFFGKNILKLKDIIEKKSFKSYNKTGKLFKLEILEDYVKFIKNNINIDKNINCIIDCGNATAGIIAPEIFTELNINTKMMYCDLDPTFPNHHPDPTVDKNLNDIVKEIKTNNSIDVGFAFDGDGDRVIAIDNLGSIIRSDILMGVFAKDILKDNDTMIYDVKCSRSLEYMIKYYNGNPVMWKTGHSLIKSKMIELGSKFGGEMSGHLFFADKYFGYDDGIYAALRLVEYLSNSTEKLSELVDIIPKYFSTPEIRIDCKNDKEKFEITQKVKSYFIKNFKCNEIDGVRIEFDTGWGLVRSSNTQPVIVCRFEAESEAFLHEIKNLVFSKIQSYGDVKIEF